MKNPGSPLGFFYTFSMALYHKWDVKNDFVYVLQFFSLISDSLDSVHNLQDMTLNIRLMPKVFETLEDPTQ